MTPWTRNVSELHSYVSRKLAFGMRGQMNLRLTFEREYRVCFRLDW